MGEPLSTGAVHEIMSDPGPPVIDVTFGVCGVPTVVEVVGDHALVPALFVARICPDRRTIGVPLVKPVIFVVKPAPEKAPSDHESQLLPETTQYRTS